MSLTVIDFTFLEGQDNEIMVKELAVANSQLIGSRHMSLRDRTNGKKYLCLTVG